MKLVSDSFSSASSFFTIYLLLLAQLSVFTAAFPHHHGRRTTDLEVLTNHTRHLLRLTQDLLKDHMIDIDVEHRFKSLPVMNNRATDLNSLQMRSTLTQLHADLQCFEHHFEWLNQATKKHRQVPLPKLGELLLLIKHLRTSLQHQMSKLELLRPSIASPSLPSIPTNPWEVAKSSLELLQRFRLFCDWSLRVLLSLKIKH